MNKIRKTKKITALAIAILLISQIILPQLGLISTISYAADEITLTFSDDEITETVSGSGYDISETTLTITSSGTYRVTGSCSEGNIEVKKGTTGVVLILDNLTLSSSTTAPIVVKKDGASVTIQLEGTSTITDLEDPENETSEDADKADAFEGAAIKVKSSSSLTIEGTGTLNVDGSSCKNGIKGAAESSITIDGGIINVEAANNGIACDGTLTINDGTIYVESEEDGIKSEPDSEDTTSAGTITINGGSVTVEAQGDGIQAANYLIINDGTINIKTLNGYNSSNFDSDSMSCKGLKASTNEQEDVESEILITGGTFYLNTADDAIHSNAYITITGGTFEIYTGDDGAHADTSLILGTEDGLERDPYITIYESYEGLEAGTVYIYSGKYYVVSSDDGINAAGGSSDGTDPGSTGGGDGFNPGGGPGSMTPGQSSQSNTGSSDYSIYIYGGTIYVNADGDGLDSNGDVNIYGGTIEVWGQASGGDNEPIDSETGIVIEDAVVFAGGTKGMTYVHNALTSINQGYIYNTTSSYSSGQTIYVKSGSTVIYQTTAPKNINYLFYTPTSSSYTFSTSTTSTTCATGNAWSHTWDEGVITTEATEDHDGVITYTCSVCGETERQTIHYVSEDEEEEEVIPYTATFDVDDGVESIDIYYTQDYTSADEEDVEIAYVRNSDTGEYDISGDGQINFLVNLKDGYSITNVTATSGTYKNIKDSDTTGVANLYRITKITSDLTITITTTQDPYTATFVTDEGVSSIDVYYTSDYENSEVETGATTAIARNSDTGEQDTSGSGQINFLVNLNENYIIDSVTITGSYNKLKDSSDTEVENMYRITKITSDLVITITTKERTTITPVISGYEDSYEYTGSNIEPEITVTIEGTETTLVEGTDYTITYGENTELGSEEGTITIESVSTSEYVFETQTVTFAIVQKEIEEDDVTVETPITYTGSKLSPEVVVEVNGTTLVKGTDYTVTYSNNTNAGTATVTITGIGNYTGTVAKYVTINKANLTITSVTARNKEYDGTNIAEVSTATFYDESNDKTITLNVDEDYSVVAIFEDEEAGTDKTVTATVTLLGDIASNYQLTSSTYETEADITAKEIEEDDVTIDGTYTYTGDEIEPTIKVEVDGVELVEGTDYEVEYSNNLNAGTATATIAGIGNYTGTVEIEFTISPKTITLAIEDVDNVTYDGTAQTPTVTVTIDGTDTELEEGIDYTVDYSNNVNSGEATITISEVSGGNYTFTETTTTFNINPYTIVDSNVSLEYTTIKYDGSEKEPTVTVTVNGTKLSSSEYNVEYFDNIEAGTATVTVTATGGNYTGTVTKEFTITDKYVLTISGISNNQTITYTGNAVELSGNLSVSSNSNGITTDDLTITWYDENGNEIDCPTDAGSYTVVYSYSDDDYEGSLTVNFEITKATSETPTEADEIQYATVGQTLSDVSLTTSGLSWVDENTTILAGSNTYYATYTQNNDTNNYTTETIEITVYGYSYINITTSVYGDGGTISDSVENVLEGQTVTITFTPNTGYLIDIVTINGEDVTSDVVDNTLEVTAGTEDLEIEVQYSELVYEEIRTTDDDGSTTDDDDEEDDDGTESNSEDGANDSGSSSESNTETDTTDNTESDSEDDTTSSSESNTEENSTSSSESSSDETSDDDSEDTSDETTDEEAEDSSENSTSDDTEDSTDDSSSDGKDDTSTAEETTSTNPTTGDNIFTYVIIVILAIIVIFIIVKNKKSNKNKKDVKRK